jgi:hypothetical protein
MKKKSVLSILIVSIIMIGTSCKKNTSGYMPVDPIVPRLVQFDLYTDKDFSNVNNIITFKISIQKATGEVLWDSVLAPMQIKDIPQLAQKLVVEKYVPGNDPSLLKVGFYYSIENVGYSWHLDSFEPGEIFKMVNFNFQ